MPTFRVAIADSSSLPARIAAYRAALERNSERTLGQDTSSSPSWRALWICASGHTVSYLQSQLATNLELAGQEAPHHALLAPGIFTFARLAEALLVQADLRILPLSGLERRWVLGQLAQQSLVAKELKYFAPIAASTGFAAQVESLVVDLKRRDIWPEQFAKSARSVRERELGVLYRRYQEYLIEHNLYDAEGRFWAAREALTHNPHLAAHLELVHVDGFSDFSTAQHDILKLLAARCDSIHISLPLDQSKDPGTHQAHFTRDELFAKPLRTLAVLRENFGQPESSEPDPEKLDPEKPTATQEQATPWETREHLRANLFRSYADLEALAPEAVAGLQQMEVVAASSEQQEIEAIAMRVKRFLQAGVAPAEIVVCFRTLGDVADRLRSVFADYSIPLTLDARRSLASASVVRRVLLLLKLHANDWPYRELLRVVGDAGIELVASQTETTAYEIQEPELRAPSPAATASDPPGGRVLFHWQQR